VVLAAGLARRGHDVRVGTFYAGGPLESDLAAAGVTVVDLGKSGRWDVTFAARLRSLVRETRPDVIHGYLVAANLVAAALRPWARGARIVWGVRASDMDLGRYDGFQEATFQVARHVSRCADVIVANSRAGARFHVHQGYPADRTVVVPNGVDTARFRPRPGCRVAVREELGLDPAAKVVGLVARLDPMKDHGTFLAAAALLARRRPEVRFVAVGGGVPGALESWRSRAAAAGVARAVRFVGPRLDPERVYPTLDVATSTSAFGEGFPNAVAEAMACGVPCVVTDVGDAGDIVGRPDRVVPPRTPEALARAWERVLDAADEDPESLRRSIEERFSVARLVERTEAVLAEPGETTA
jgi:glycosyltransferase involved in cell wall biosynthesis